LKYYNIARAYHILDDEGNIIKKDEHTMFGREDSFDGYNRGIINKDAY